MAQTVTSIDSRRAKNHCSPTETANLRVSIVTERLVTRLKTASAETRAESFALPFCKRTTKPFMGGELTHGYLQTKPDAA